MSKIWLVVWFFNLDGEFTHKEDTMFDSRIQCVQAAGIVAKKYVNVPIAISLSCVTNNHHEGISQDPGIDFD